MSEFSEWMHEDEVADHTVYIAGPMTGIRSFNIPAFDEMAAALRADGFSVVSPAELDDPATRALQMASETGSMSDLPPGESWGKFLARDVELISDGGIEAIVVLPGWERSRGARLETYVAYLDGLPILTATVYPDIGVVLDPVPRITLFRAWTAEPALSIHATMTTKEPNWERYPA